jgi:hypothetical protein
LGRCNVSPLLREAEIEKLRSGLGHHDVARLQIAMGNAFAVRLVERVRNRDRAPKRLLERQRTSHQTRGERLPFQILHHQMIDTVLPPDVVQRADMRMVQTGDGPRLALETPAPIRPLARAIAQHLDRHETIETGISGAVHVAHTPRSERTEDLVGPETRAGG